MLLSEGGLHSLLPSCTKTQYRMMVRFTERDFFHRPPSSDIDSRITFAHLAISGQWDARLWVDPPPPSRSLRGTPNV